MWDRAIRMLRRARQAHVRRRRRSAQATWQPAPKLPRVKQQGVMRTLPGAPNPNN